MEGQQQVAHQDGRFIGSGGLVLSYRNWTAGRSAAATVVISHGLGEHSGRYDHVGERLAGAGYSVWALDHRGHGRSEGRRAYVERFSTFVADLETFRLLVRDLQPRVPQYLLGHSMGGAIALAHTIERPAALDGLILSAPAVDPARGARRSTIAAVRFAARVAPHLGTVVVDATGVSRDPAVVDAYRADPLVHHGKISARLATQFVSRTARFRAEVGALRLPLLWLHGTADTLVHVECSRQLFPLVGSEDKTYLEYPGLAHELVNEPERDRVLDDVLTWLDERRAAQRFARGRIP